MARDARFPHLPPLAALRVFEAAGRHLSFTNAAAELCVTTSAVSRQIRALEEQLGRPLFERQPRGLALTKDGASYLAQVAEALRRLDDASATLRGDGSSGDAARRAGRPERCGVSRLDRRRDGGVASGLSALPLRTGSPVGPASQELGPMTRRGERVRSGETRRPLESTSRSAAGSSRARSGPWCCPCRPCGASIRATPWSRGSRSRKRRANVSITRMLASITRGRDVPERRPGAARARGELEQLTERQPALGDDVALADAALGLRQDQRAGGVLDADRRTAAVPREQHASLGGLPHEIAVRRRHVVAGAVGVADAERDAGKAAFRAGREEEPFGFDARAHVRRHVLARIDLVALGGRADGAPSDGADRAREDEPLHLRGERRVDRVPRDRRR